jgi:aryl-alcohol dehydrogenase-like predicted oxidoreductase
LRALDDLVRRGDVRYIGCSNFRAWQIMEALWASDRRNLTAFATSQPNYSLVHRREFEEEQEAVCLRHGLAVLPYAPLAGGFLTGKYHRDQVPDSQRAQGLRHLFTEDKWTLLDKMEQLAKSKGDHTIAQLALAWLLANPAITSPIIGATSVAQLNDNLGALALKLTEEDVKALNALTKWEEEGE